MFWNYPGSADYIWRTILMLAAVFTAVTMYFRLKLPETARYTLYVEQNLKETNKNMETVLHQHFDGTASAANVAAADGATRSGDESPSSDAIVSSRTSAEIPRLPASQSSAALTRSTTSKAPAARLSTRELFRKFGYHLFGCAMCWFLLDIAFYSQNLFQSVIFTEIGWLPAPYTMTAAQEVYYTARAQCIIACCSVIPGYWFTVATVDWMGT